MVRGSPIRSRPRSCSARCSRWCCWRRRRAARHVDRAAAAGVLHARGRVGDVPRPRRRRAVGHRPRRSPRSAPGLLRRRADAAGAPARRRARRGDRPAARRRARARHDPRQRRLPLGRRRRPAAVRDAARRSTTATSWLAGARRGRRAARDRSRSGGRGSRPASIPAPRRALGVPRRAGDALLLALLARRGRRRAARGRRAARRHAARRARRDRAPARRATLGALLGARGRARASARAPAGCCSRTSGTSRRARRSRSLGGVVFGVVARSAGRGAGAARMRRPTPRMRRPRRALAAGYGAARCCATSTFAANAGQVVAVLGPNGGGKTTLFRALLGELAHEGTVDDRRRVASVPQGDRARLDFPVSALDVALMGAYGRTPWFRRSARADRDAALAALDRVGLADRAQRPLRHAVGRPAPARADRPRARPGRRRPAARRAVRRRRPRRARSGSWAVRRARRRGPHAARRHARRRAGAALAPRPVPPRRQIAFGTPPTTLTAPTLEETYGARARRARRRASAPCRASTTTHGPRCMTVPSPTGSARCSRPSCSAPRAGRSASGSSPTGRPTRPSRWRTRCCPGSSSRRSPARRCCSARPAACSSRRCSSRSRRATRGSAASSRSR